MKVKMITPETRHFFRHLISTDVFQLMEQGEPVIALGLLARKLPVGAIAGILDENDIFTVLSLYVAEEYRRKGGGSMLMSSLETLLDNAGSGAAILSYVEEPGEESTYHEFLQFMESLQNIETTSLEHLYEIPLGSFYSSPLFSEDSNSRLIKTLVDLTEQEKKVFLGQYKSMNDGWMGKWFHSYKANQEFSFARIKEDKAAGLLFLEKSTEPDKEPVIIFFGDLNLKVACALLGAFVNASRNELSPDIKVLLPVPDDRCERLFEQLHDVRNLQHNFVF